MKSKIAEPLKCLKKLIDLLFEVYGHYYQTVKLFQIKELAKNGFPNLANSERYKDLPAEDLAKEQEKFNSHMLVTMLYSYINDLMELKES